MDNIDIIKRLALLDLADEKAITVDLVHSQYRKLSKLYHPDSSPLYKDGDKFRKLTDAHDFIIENIDSINVLLSNNFADQKTSVNSKSSNYSNSESKKTESETPKQDPPKKSYYTSPTGKTYTSSYGNANTKTNSQSSSARSDNRSKDYSSNKESNSYNYNSTKTNQNTVDQTAPPRPKYSSPNESSSKNTIDNKVGKGLGILFFLIGLGLPLLYFIYMAITG